MRYRSEIDGLRAVAVIPVILFHAGFGVFSGGFVGVDVFFVISGYLITTILITEIAEGRFSIIGFYERRARRILPALCFVMLCCLPFAWNWMLPSQFKDFSQSLIAVSLFVSNILFWRESGYFAPEAEHKPLLHTWSLAVEEQFYIFFPLLLVLLWRFGRNPVFYSVIALSVLSLMLAEYGWRKHSTANFYLIPTRAWELGAGSICAFVIYRGEKVDRGPLALVGLVLVLASVFIYDDTTPFPSLYALAPVVGTSLIILFAGPTNWTGRLLSAKALVGLGLISYSAYLWHQPLFAFARLRTYPDLTLMLWLSVLSLGLAFISWKFIEQPFRDKGRKPFSQKTIFAFGSAATLLFLAIGVAGQMSDGAPGRFADTRVSPAELDHKTRINHGLHSDCDQNFTNSANCRTSDMPEILLWGDSYAMHLAQALTASEPDLRMQQHTMSECAPTAGIALMTHDRPTDWARHCITFNDRIIDWLEDTPSVEYVVLSSLLQMLQADILDRSGDYVAHSDRSDRVRQALMATIRDIQSMGRAVVVVSMTPQNGRNIGQCLVHTQLFDRNDDDCDFSVAEMSRDAAGGFDLLEGIAGDIPVINLTDIICVNGICDTMKDGVFIYRDTGHLSHEGSAYLGQTHKFVDMIRAVAR